MTERYRKQTYRWIGQKTAQVGTYCRNELFPTVCAVCGKVGKPVCDSCLLESAYQWQQDAHPLVRGIPVYYLEKYTNLVFRQLVQAGKYRGRPDCLEEVINRTCGYLPAGRDVVWVPIPITRQRFAVRGYNQAEIIAAQLAALHGGTVLHALRNTPQWHSSHAVGSSRGQRLRRSAMCTRRVRIPSYVWLVDDVITTGGTTRAAIRALRQAGCAVGGVVAICCTPLLAGTCGSRVVST